MYVKPIEGDLAIRDAVVANISRKKETLKAFITALENRPLKDPIHEPYICLGSECLSGEMAGATTRKAIIGMLSYPLYRAVLEERTGYQFIVQAYFAQSYENPEDIGPGAVVGLRRPNTRRLGARWKSASVAFKMLQWVDDTTDFQYEDEDTARTKLWSFAEEHYPQGMSYLRGMKIEPTEPQLYPLQVSPDLHALLGIEALRQLVAEHLGLRLVLIDGDRLIGENHLRWEHYSTWAV